LDIEKPISQFLLLSKHYWRDQMKKDERGGTCSTHGVGEKHI